MVSFVPLPALPVNPILQNWAVANNRQVGLLHVPGFQGLPVAVLDRRRYVTDQSVQGMLFYEKVFGFKLIDIRREGDMRWLYQGNSPERWA